MRLVILMSLCLAIIGTSLAAFGGHSAYYAQSYYPGGVSEDFSSLESGPFRKYLTQLLCIIINGGGGGGRGGILTVDNNPNTVAIFIVDGLLVLYITLSFKPDSLFSYYKVLLCRL